jgi:hypothetical protein
MQMKEGKGGYVADGLLSVDMNSVKVIVSREKENDSTIETKVLEGTVELQPVQE